MKPYSAPNLFLDRLWKEKQAQRHKETLRTMKSTYAHADLNRGRIAPVTYGGKKEQLMDGKWSETDS
jgi:hypothetical protein